MLPSRPPGRGGSACQRRPLYGERRDEAETEVALVWGANGGDPTRLAERPVGAEAPQTACTAAGQRCLADDQPANALSIAERELRVDELNEHLARVAMTAESRIGLRTHIAARYDSSAQDST